MKRDGEQAGRVDDRNHGRNLIANDALLDEVW